MYSLIIGIPLIMIGFILLIVPFIPYLAFGADWTSIDFDSISVMSLSSTAFLGVGLIVLVAPNFRDIRKVVRGIEIERHEDEENTTEFSPTIRTCVMCGKKISWEAKECRYCGHDFT
jgi:hypothetical protein